MSIFVSTFLYSAAKIAGDSWPTYIAEQCRNLGSSEWPGLRTVGAMTTVSPIELYVEASTYITRARCVAAGRFLRSRASVWVTVDDDILVDRSTIHQALLVCRAIDGGVTLPYLNRDGKSIVCRDVAEKTEWVETSAGALPVRCVSRTGFGFVAMTRGYVERIVQKNNVEFFREDDLRSKEPDCPLLFVEGAENGSWIGEDYYFSRLAETSGEPLRLLLDAPCEHAGRALKLSAAGEVLLRDAAAAKELVRAAERRENRDAVVK